MTDRDDLLRKVAESNPLPRNVELPVDLADSRPPLALLTEGDSLMDTQTRPPSKAAKSRRWRGPLVAGAAAALVLLVGAALWALRDGRPLITAGEVAVMAPASQSPLEWRWAPQLGETSEVTGVQDLVEGAGCYGIGFDQVESRALTSTVTTSSSRLGLRRTPYIVATDRGGAVTEVGNPFDSSAWLCSVAANDTHLLAVGSGVWWSKDGITWNTIEVFDDYGGLNLDGSNLMWAAAGPGGYLVLGREGAVWFSEDLQTWYEISLDGGHDYGKTVWGFVGPTGVAVGEEIVIAMVGNGWIGTRRALTPTTSIETWVSPVGPMLLHLEPPVVPPVVGPIRITVIGSYEGGYGGFDLTECPGFGGEPTPPPDLTIAEAYIQLCNWTEEIHPDLSEIDSNGFSTVMTVNIDQEDIDNGGVVIVAGDMWVSIGGSALLQVAD